MIGNKLLIVSLLYSFLNSTNLLGQNEMPPPPPAPVEQSDVIPPENMETAEESLPGPVDPENATGNLEEQGITVEGTRENEISLQGIIEDYDYNPEGKRDPFEPFQAPASISSGVVQGPVFPLQKYSLNQLNLIGIIWGVNSPLAMVKDPSGKLHYIRERDKVGNNNGYVAKIRENELIVVETFMINGEISTQTQIIQLARSNK